MKILFSLAMIMLATVSVMAQYTVSGKVVDEKTGEPIIGAAVMETGTTNGTVTDIDGNFSIKVSADPAKLNISYLGYKSQEVQVAKTGAKSDAGTIKLATDAKALDDVIVKGSVAVARKTPVALSAIDPITIEDKLGTQEFPEVLKSTPGVHASKDGGGYGDSKINMRGFQSANVAVVVNGVPMNDMEWGGVYWSNWTGLSDVTRSMQTQRGLGASKISSPSVGGTINIVTKSIDAKRGGLVSYAIGNDGYNKITAAISSGMNDKGWAFNLLLAKTWGNGYIQGTEFEGHNWFVNISKRINNEHQLSLTAFGAPQWHNQRSSYDGLTIDGWQKVKDYMKGESVYKYNATYGFGKNGERKTSAKNKYHKPQISLNHQWQIADNQSLSTAIYTSIGRGYGYSGQYAASQYSSGWYGSSDGILNTTFRNADGTFAYDKIQEMNEQSDHGSDMVMSISKNYHTWLGLVSNYNNDINENLNISGGVDFRWYKGVHTNELIDLYNGAYYVDRFRKNVKKENNDAANDPNFTKEKLHVGDVVYRDYDGYTVQAGLFGQAEYSLDQLNVYVSGSVSDTKYWRYDRYYYDADHAESKKLNFWAGTIKGGANYNLNEHNNVFVNAGFISRAPFFSGGAFLSSTVSNMTNPNAVNEKIASVEVGYGYESSTFKATLNAYYTKWMDKTMTRSGDYMTKDGIQDQWTVNMEGVDARHMGIEVELVARPATWVELTGMLSLGDWVWDSEATGYFYNSASQPMADTNGTIASGIGAKDHAKMTFILDKVKVGGSAQTTAAIGANFKPMKGLKVGADWTLRARNFADWSISSYDIMPNAVVKYADEAWKIPAASTVDMHASYTFNICKDIKGTFSGNVENLLDQEYIADAYDGEDHDWKTAYRVFYGFGRTYSVRFKIAF
ncbi:MAG: carboxypeptidase-like regulatory domain-containing protein [Bacteroidales bacterium]|nr:carboxypeptidase-like regulatory domain-containing protein [Bacteroidales bacterium]